MLLTLQINANNIEDGVATFQLENALSINKMTLVEVQSLLVVSETTQLAAGKQNPRLYATFNNINTQSIICYGDAYAKAEQNAFPLYPASYSGDGDPQFGGGVGNIMSPLVIIDEPTIIPADFTIELFEIVNITTSTVITSAQIDEMFVAGGTWEDNTHLNLIFQVELNSANRMNLND